MIGPAFLFCPADRPERYAKALAAADVVIVDLEDAVAPESRAGARDALVAAGSLDPARVIVRINPAGTPDHTADLAALAGTPLETVMLAKTESAAAVAALARPVIALCETARGVLEAAAIAAVDNTAGLMWGAEDLVAGLNGRSSRGADGRYRAVAAHARSAVLLAAGAYGRPAIDSVFLDIADLDGLAEESRDAADSGFAAKACIHPSQAAVVRDAFRPSEEEIAHAERILAAAAGAAGVFAFEGRMVDAPVLRHAERTLAARASLP